MLSRRVFELLACGTPVVSGPSIAVEKLFDGLVPVVSTEADAVDQIAIMLDDSSHRRKRSHLGYRYVHSKHTYSHRLGEIGDVIGVPTLRRYPSQWLIGFVFQNDLK